MEDHLTKQLLDIILLLLRNVVKSLIISSDYFVYKSTNLNPWIKVLFLDSAQRGLLKNVQNHFSRHLGSQEIAKTQMHTFFWNTLYYLLLITCYFLLLLAICSLLLATTCYSLLATSFLLLATCYFLLASNLYLLLVTCYYLLLATCYLPHAIWYLLVATYYYWVLASCY